MGKHFELKALLGKSAASMLWSVVDVRSQQPRLVLLPRQQPADIPAWLAGAQRAARLKHPALGQPVEFGVADPWPFIAYERVAGLTLTEYLARHRVPAAGLSAGFVRRAAEGLAALHDAAWLLGDLQAFHLVLAEDGSARLLGLGLLHSAPLTDPSARSQHQAGVEDEVLCLGLLLNRLLGGQAPLETTDTLEVIKRLAPRAPMGKDFVRLGYEQAHPVDDVLRAIANRATASQPSQRYLHGRPLARALEGWMARAQSPDGGPAALLLEKLQRYGTLPISRPEAIKSIQAGELEKRHVAHLAGLVQQDVALTLELLRRVNLARQQQGSAGEPVLNVQRAISMLGLGALAEATQALKPWPGVLAPERVLNLRLALARAHKAADLALALAPPGFEPDVLRLTALVQNLGRLLLHYHLPDEAEQIQRLMQAPPSTEAQPNPQGLNERQAAFSVLGCDIDQLACAALRHWGLGDIAQQLAQRPEPDQPIATPHSDLDVLRLTCALSNELVDAMALQEPKRRLHMEACNKRYGRALSLSPRTIQLALFPEGAQAALPRFGA
jgi:eukaryotic-like serine/threonine-protein kinase